eukprot:TRINITY_DN20176_c0_g1_i1.p1 TRINITY_DN20176_c0_g1~~TRINITY_DN20176_c0_g1_i1.p1  ORF type:complete len:214 (+),score=53.97 TRINITY_DN20176_c0_g1_i1:56-643(+)
MGDGDEVGGSPRAALHLRDWMDAKLKCDEDGQGCGAGSDQHLGMYLAEKYGLLAGEAEADADPTPAAPASADTTAQPRPGLPSPTKPEPGPARSPMKSPAKSSNASPARRARDMSYCNAAYTEQQLATLWETLDDNGNGWLELDEFQEFYKSLETYGLDPDTKFVDKILRQYNILGDGRVSYDEFALIMLKIASR